MKGLARNLQSEAAVIELTGFWMRLPARSRHSLPAVFRELTSGRSVVTVPRNDPRAYPAPLACESPSMFGLAELGALRLRGWLRQTLL
jgi:hypothetical protein